MLWSDVVAILIVLLFSSGALMLTIAWIAMVRIAHREKMWFWFLSLIFCHLFIFPLFLGVNWQVAKTRALLYPVAIACLLALFPLNYWRDLLIVDETSTQLQNDPQNPELHAARGKALLSLDRDEEALDHFREAWLRDSSNLEYADNMSSILEKQKKYEAVIDAIGSLGEFPASTPAVAAQNLHCRLLRAYRIRKMGAEIKAREEMIQRQNIKCPDGDSTGS